MKEQRASTRKEICHYFLPEHYHIFKNGDWKLYLDTENVKYAVANPVGARIMESVAEHSRLPDIQEDLCREFGASFDPVLCKSFLDEMIDKEVLFPGPPGTQKSSRTRIPEPTTPGSMYFMVTTNCNLNCSYCYNRIEREKLNKSHELSVQEFEKIVGRAAASGVEALFFTGGEPLTRPDLFELTAAARKHDISCYLITNGLLVQPNLDAISENFRSVNISLDGDISEVNDLTRGSGTYEKIIGAIRSLLAKSECTVVINTVLTKHNVKRLPEMWRFVTEELPGAVFVPALWTEPAGWAGEENLRPPIHELMYAEDLVSEYLSARRQSGESDVNTAIDVIGRKEQCGAGWSIALGPDGCIYPCQGLVTETLRCGSALDDNIADIFRESQILAKCRKAKPGVIAACADCHLRRVCAGGCRAISHRLTGTLDSMDGGWCEYFLELWEKRLWRSALKDVRGMIDKGLYKELTQ